MSELVIPGRPKGPNPESTQEPRKLFLDFGFACFASAPE